ncbi:hypothetical protein Sste5344_007862 [Sporothrix stenoceras]
MYTPEQSQVEPLNASAFLLDFLYPKGALTFVRKLSSVSSRRVRSNSSMNTSKSTSTTNSPKSPILPNTTRKPARQVRSLLSSASPASSEIPAEKSAAPDEDDLNDNEQAAPDDETPAPAAEQRAILDELSRLLQLTPTSNDRELFDQARRLYNKLEDSPHVAALKPALFMFLAPSKKEPDVRRTIKLFNDFDPSLWTADMVSTVVKAKFKVNKRDEALDIFQRSTETNAWADGAAPGFGLLIASALKTNEWPLVSHVWNIYKNKTGRNKAEAALLKSVLEMSNLPEKLQSLAALINLLERNETTPLAEFETRSTGKYNLVALKEAFKAILEASLHRLDPDVAYPLVKTLTNPRVYENFIQILINKNRPDLAARAYSEYRLMPKFKPHVVTLTAMVRHVYYPDNARGMEEVLKDWYNSRGRLNFWGYQKFLAFYASRGDVTSVYRLWSEFTNVYPTAIESAEDVFAHLLKVHAVRGDLAQVEQAFAEIWDKYKVKPNTICWNIRLHIYVERGHYTKAMQIFEELCEAVEPDDYSFSTIMTIVGGRGDINLVSDLYWLAQQCGVQITEAIIDPIVEAYCQNDMYNEAERLCVTTTRDEKVGGKPYTALWNTLLHHHALRHDLVAVNRILNVMTRLNVTYDNNTYSALLFALAQCRQPRRAVELLRAAQEDGIFRPSAHHYTLLMMAYIRSKQPHRALQVNRLMHHMGFQRSSQQIQMVIKAFSQWQDFPKGDKPAEGGLGAAERRDLFAKALREFQRSLSTQSAGGGGGRRGSSSLPSSRAKEAVGREAARMHLGAVRRFSFVIFMLVQARDFAGVEEVMQLYKSIAPAEERQQPLPLKLCNALMLSDYYEGRFDRVKEMWQNILGRTQEISRPQALNETRLESILGHTKAAGVETDIQTDIQAAIAANELTPESTQQSTSTAPEKREKLDRRVVAKLRYGLTDPLKTMQRLYAAERDSDGLMTLVNNDILSNGFLLDSKNWNHYVQNLARLGRTREAFSVCEERLMDQWSGFSPLRARNRGGSEEDGSLSEEADVLKRSRSSSPSASQPSQDPNGSDSSDPFSNKTGSGSPTMSRLQHIREGATRYNRPTTYTFMVLAKAYMELEQMALWSSIAEREFRTLGARFPRSVHAVRTMVRMNSRIEGRVFGGTDNVATDLGMFPLVNESAVPSKDGQGNGSPNRRASWDPPPREETNN